MQFDVATNFSKNNQHVKISLITLKVSAACTVQQCSNVIKFHEAILGLFQNKVVHEQKDKKCLRNTNILNYLPNFDNSSIFAVKYQ